MTSSDASIPTYDQLLDGLTVPQAADISRRPSFVLRDDIRTGKLSAYKVGGRWRILRADLDAYLNALVTPSRGIKRALPYLIESWERLLPLRSSRRFALGRGARQPRRRHSLRSKHCDFVASSWAVASEGNKPRRRFGLLG